MYMPWRRWTSWLVAGFTGLVLFALIVPAIQQAREAARRTEVRNRLHEIGLAVHNYCDVHESLPPGGVMDGEGEGYHGWMTSTLPYLDQDPCYSMINFDYAWDDRRNDHIFRMSHGMFEAPGIVEVATSEGYALTHYQGNPNLLYRNSHVRFEDMPEGLEQTWLMGEVAGRYQPQGYPFNWRPLGDCLNCGPESYRSPSGFSSCFLFADASVRTITNNVSADVLTAMAADCRRPDAEAVAVPDRRFECVTRRWNVGLLGSREGDPFDSLYAMIWYNSEQFAETAVFVARSDVPTLDDMETVISTCPEIRELIDAPVIDDECATMFVKLHNLEYLTTTGIDVSHAGLADLGRLTKLEHLEAGSVDADTLSALRSALPGCEIRAASRQ
jgi:Protein of unknown function (DUF1559)